MAIDQGSETVTLKTQERTWRIEIETPMGQVPTITAHRETVTTLPDGSVVGRETGIQVKRSFAELSDDKDAQSVAAAIPDIVDRWRQADIEAQKAQPNA